MSVNVNADTSIVIIRRLEKQLDEANSEITRLRDGWFLAESNLNAAPIPPADVAELQSEVTLSRELLAKLVRENAELTRLLEEAKRQAVPEGWKAVPIQMTDEMRDAGNIYVLNRGTLCRIWNDMLSAAPQPEGVDK